MIGDDVISHVIYENRSYLRQLQLEKRKTYEPDSGLNKYMHSTTSRGNNLSLSLCFCCGWFVIFTLNKHFEFLQASSIKLAKTWMRKHVTMSRYYD